MICIQEGSKGTCCYCWNNPATKVINGMSYCTDCADTILIKVIGKCSKAIEGAKVNISITPIIKKEKK